MSLRFRDNVFERNDLPVGTIDQEIIRTQRQCLRYLVKVLLVADRNLESYSRLGPLGTG